MKQQNNPFDFDPFVGLSIAALLFSAVLMMLYMRQSGQSSSSSLTTLKSEPVNSLQTAPTPIPMPTLAPALQKKLLAIEKRLEKIEVEQKALSAKSWMCDDLPYKQKRACEEPIVHRKANLMREEKNLQATLQSYQVNQPTSGNVNPSDKECGQSYLRSRVVSNYCQERLKDYALIIFGNPDAIDKAANYCSNMTDSFSEAQKRR